MQKDKINNGYEIYQTGYLIGCLGRFRGWGESKMKLFLNIVMLHIKFKGTTHDSNMIVII